MTIVLQSVAFSLAVIGVIAALYVLALNLWNSAHRHLSLLFLVFALNNFCIGLILDPTVTRDSAVPLTHWLGVTAVAFPIALLLLTVVLLKPAWMQGRRRWLGWLLYGLIVLPGVLTVVDAVLGTQFWYTGLPADYAGGFVTMSEYADGSVAAAFRMFSFGFVSLLSLLLAVYAAWFDKRASFATRRLAGLLFGAQLVASVVQFTAGSAGALPALISSSMYVVVYTYATFAQMISERRLQRGRLQPRLVAIVLVIVVPLLVVVAFFLTNQAAQQLTRNADEQLRLANAALRGNVDIWLRQNTLVVQQLAAQPDIVSMDPVLQKPILVETARIYGYLFLVHTTDVNGVNVARNDDGELQDYGDRAWFQGGVTGAPVTMQPLVSRTTGRPALNLATPIRDAGGNVIGVASIVAELDEISNQVQGSQVGETGLAYVVAPDNHVVAHPDPAYSNELRDLSDYAPVLMLRQGQAGQIVTFVDEQGVRWRAYVDLLTGDVGQGWGIVVQQQEDQVLGGLQQFQQISTITVVLGSILLGLLVTAAMRQAFQPVGSLTATVAAITAGDLTREAPVESEDELGSLARAFNSMTAQVRGLIGGLEERVAARTADLEARSRYLEASAQVGRAASSILDADRLVREVAEIIRERFGLYYVALFIVDPAREWAVQLTGTGETGRARVARGYRLAVSAESSMIGWCIVNARARIAQEAEKDAVRVVSPELPDTHSEVALPLRSRGRVIGALSLQSDRPNAFDEAALSVLQVMADQVAVALDNAQLFAESQAALEQSRQAYGELTQRAWTQLLSAGQDIGYRYTQQALTPVAGDWQPEMVHAFESKEPVVEMGEDRAVLAAPLKVRDQVIGVVNLKKASGQAWTDEESALVEALAEQLGVALEGARLYQDTQRRAAREQLVGQVTARMRQSLDVSTVLQTAVDEMRQALGLVEVQVRVDPPTASEL